MINFDFLLKNKCCVCVPEGGGWVQEGIGVFRIEIGHFFADHNESIHGLTKLVKRYLQI